MKKRIAALAAALCLTLSALTVPVQAVSCFPRYTGGSGSIAAALNELGADGSYANRKEIAAANGIDSYRGTAAQNLRMLELLKQGALIDPAASTCFPPYTGSSGSIAAALNELGADGSYASRKEIAAANQHKVSFLHQDKNTCKATSAAMAVNLILGRDENVTADMIYTGVLCRSLEGEEFTGSDGNLYRASYRTDGYTGSLSELSGVVDAALNSGLPVVVPVHSSATRHHWIVLVGRDGKGGYLAADPARSGRGSVAAQTRSMAALGYSFGLTDYDEPHYGYITFQQVPSNAP